MALGVKLNEELGHMLCLDGYASGDGRWTVLQGFTRLRGPGKLNVSSERNG